MRQGFLRIVVSIGVVLWAWAAAYAGAVFDDLLNYAVIDQRCPADVREEGLVLTSQKKADMMPIARGRPVGQTFRTGNETVVLWRICVGLCHWPDDWTEGESLTFTLYDSPRKAKTLYARTIEHGQKLQKWDTPFDVHLPTKPNTDYYFEIVHNGGGDGVIRVVFLPRNEYAAGRAYVGGAPRDDIDLYFVTLGKARGDRTANWKRFLDRFDYDHPLLKDAGAAYRSGDLDRAGQLVLRAFETHLETAEFLWRPDPARPVDTREVDAIADEGRLYHEKNGQSKWIAMSDQTTWREVWEDGQRFIGQNDVFRKLGFAYAATKNEKYATKLNELMADFMQDNPSPFEGGMRGARWTAMGIAWRLNDAFNGFAAAMKSKGLTDDVKLGWIEYQSRMAHFAQTEKAGGNQANATAEALMQFAANFPLYRASKPQFQFGFDLLVRNSLKLFRPDGACSEPAMNYHGYSLATLMAGLDTARRFKLPIPPEIEAVVERALAYTAYVLKPDGTIPPYGDTDSEDFRPDTKKWDGWRTGECRKGYEQFGRKDLLYIATAGRQGERPTQLSSAFPDTGHYVMRSDWGGDGGEGFADARWLFFRAGRAGSHGHDDLNMVTLYAYGRPLLIDPGRTTYGTELMFELTRNRSHNVLLVNDEGMAHPPPKQNAWRTSPAMDLADNTYEGLYAGVHHRRAVLFVRPDYFVLFDDAVAQKPSRIGVNFWLTPPAPAVDEAKRSVRTQEPNGANILVKAIGPARVDLAQRNGTLDLGGKRDDIPVITFWQNNAVKAGFVTLLYPFPRDAVDIPARVAVGRDAVLCEIGSSSQTDYVFWAHRPCLSPKSAAVFSGRAGVLRMAKDAVASVGLVDGTRVTLNEKPVLSGGKPMSCVSVRYLADAVEIVADPPEPTLEVAAFGRPRALANGKAIAVRRERFRPFE